MKFENVYFINGTAYAGKSTIVKALANKHDGIACEENYHDALIADLDSAEFPCLTYTRDLANWSDFIRRTPDAYEAWINGGIKECTILELKILEEISRRSKKVFVDTNIPIEILWDISDIDHVLIMLADPDISVNRFFDRPDKEKQFLYQLLLKEENPDISVLVVEKQTSGYSGKANKGGGVLQYFDLEKTTPEMFNEYHANAVGGYLANQNLLKKYVAMNNELLDKMESWGVNIPKKRIPTGPMTYMVGVDLDLTLKMRATATKLGVKFIDKTTISDLLTRDGKIAGAVLVVIGVAIYATADAKKDNEG